MVVAVCAVLLVGYPVALTLGGVSLIFAALGAAAGMMDLALLGALPQRIFGIMTNEVLLAIPLFIFMGVMLERSRIAEELLETMGRLFGSCRAGLASPSPSSACCLAAAKGIVGATTVTMGLIVLPTMLRHGYDKALAAGTVAATATLAQIFPPATVLVLLGDQLSNSYQAAQLAQGNFAPQTVSVADLFAGAIMPGFALVLLYILYLIAVAMFFPKRSPAIAPDPAAPRGFALVRRLDRGAGRAAVAHPRRAWLHSRRRCDADRSGLGRCGRRNPACRAQVRRHGPDDAGDGADDGDHQHDLFDPDRRNDVQPGVPRPRRRRHGRARAHQSAGRRRRRDAGGDGGDVLARLRDGRLRDHFRGGADRGAGAVAKCRASIRSGSAS